MKRDENKSSSRGGGSQRASGIRLSHGRKRKRDETTRSGGGETPTTSARAQHERDVAIMSADKRVTVANAKLKAIQESFVEGEATP